MIQSLFVINVDAARLVALLSGHGEALALLREAEWEPLIKLARKLGVAQMLYTAVESLAISPPPRVAEEIRTMHLASVVHSVKLYHELEKILQAFNQDAITVVPVKGVWLGEAIYGSVALRRMDDMDLWVQRSQIDEASRVMARLGYAQDAEYEGRPSALQDELLGEKKFVRRGTPMVELHWALFTGEWLRHTARVDEEALLQRTLPYKSETVRQLSVEDSVLYIAIHLAINHQMSLWGFRALLDLESVRQKRDVDWGVVAGRARLWRIATPIWLVLWMMEQLFGDAEKQLPLRELEPSPFRRWLLRRLVTPQAILDVREVTGLKKYFLLLAMVDKPSDAFFLVWRTLVPDRIWLTLRYKLQDAPFWRVWLQWLWHPLRLLLKREI